MELSEIINAAVNLVKSGEYHKYYKRTVEVAREYRKIITAKGLSDDLRLTSPVTETDEMFKVREEITHITSKSIASNIKKVFYDVGKSDNLQTKIEYQKDTDGKNKKSLEERLKVYAGSKSLHKYLEIDLVDLVFEDPNAFVVTEFDSFDNRRNRAEPYPVVYRSKEVVDFLYKNNILQYLTIHQKKTASTEDGQKPINWYIVFGADSNIEIEQRPDNKPLPGEIFNDEVIIVSDLIVSFISDGEIYDVSVSTHNTGKVSAFRAGYETDPETEHKTVVGPLEPALPRFKTLLKSDSELQITITKNAHPQKYHYTGSDTGNRSIAEMARDINNVGIDSPNSALERTTIPLPKNALDSEVINLEKLVYYHYLPTEFITWLSGFVDEMEAKCKKAVFNSDTFERDTTVSTATEKVIERESVNSTLKPFADKFSESYIFTCLIISSQMDLGDDLTVIHSFSGDFKTVSLSELIDQYDRLSKADAPKEVKEKVSEQMLEKQFKDDPEGLSRIRVQSQHRPFKGKKYEEVLVLLVSPDVARTSKVLHSNFDQIFSELELENEGFYSKNYKERNDLISKKVASLISDLDEGKEIVLPGLGEE